MVGRSPSYLGVAIADHAITCAELSSAGSARAAQRHSARRTAVFDFPAGLSLDTPDATGQALAAFLRQKKFSSSRVIIGIPARWLIALEKELPPADDQQARAALRLQVERLAVAESGEVVFDFAGNADARQPTRVLLVGMLKQRLEKIERLMEAAGMNVVAVTSTGLAMASAAASRNDDGGFLALSQGGGELVWRAGGAPRMLRHVPVAVNGHELPTTAPLSAELRRLIAMAPTNGTVQSRSVLLLDGVGLSGEQISELSERLGVSVRASGPAEALGVDVPRPVASGGAADPELPGQGRFAPAMALAIAGAHAELLPINFKHSRLAPSRIRRLDSRAALGIAVAAVLLIASVSLFWIVRQRQGELDELTTQLAEMKESVSEARNVVDRFNYGSGFFPGARPPVLDGLRELTLSFRDSDQLWTTSFKISADGKGTLSGKAADQKTVGDLLDRMRGNPRFSDVKVQDIREADARSREVTFTANFVFK
jgi:hypothetical protein